MPDLVISCGKRGAMAALGLRAHYPDAKTRFIHIQDPRIDPRYFDLVVAMAHDKVNAPNVLKTRFALHTVTPQALQGAALHFAPRFAGYGRPLAAVLLGGSTHKYRMTEAAMRAIIASLQRLLDHSPCSLLITPSRRTGGGYIEMLNQAFAGNPRVYVYDFCGENPYMGMLALADAIIVTDDSVNMMSEACATGKPLYILPLAGHVDTKPERFAAQLLHDRIARRLDGALETWPYEVIDEMSGLAQEIKERFSLAEV
jgi:mitochondrial fission protein ELM1